MADTLHAIWEDVRYPDCEDYLKDIIIVYVDDHPLFSSATEKAVKEKYFPESNWFHFSDTGEALDFISSQIKANKTISFLFTDLILMVFKGMNLPTACAAWNLKKEMNLSS